MTCIKESIQHPGKMLECVGSIFMLSSKMSFGMIMLYSMEEY